MSIYMRRRQLEPITRTERGIAACQWAGRDLRGRAWVEVRREEVLLGLFSMQKFAFRIKRYLKLRGVGLYLNRHLGKEWEEPKK